MITQTEMGVQPRSQGRNIQGIVLDAVGTLIEARPSVVEVYEQTARRRGLILNGMEIARRFRKEFAAAHAGDTGEALASDETIEMQRWRRIVAETFPELADPDASGAFEELWEHFAQPGSWRTFPDTAPTIAALTAAGLRLAIGTNFDGRLRQVVAGLPELAGCTANLVVSAEVGHRKPHPDFYRAACARLGLKPGEVLWIGDDPENDLLGPRRVGMRAVLIDRGDRLKGSSWPRITDLTQALSLIEHVEDDGFNGTRPSQQGGRLGGMETAGR